MAQSKQSKQTQQPEEVQRRNKTFRQWKGVNTQSARVSIPEDTWYDLENLIPIGNANVHTIPNVSNVIASLGLENVYWMQFATLGSYDFMFLFTSSGKVYEYNITLVSMTLINASTPLSGSGSRMDQWKNTEILIIDGTGYYSWDGGTFALISGTGVPSYGSDIAVYQDRVWIAQGRVITLSGPDDFTAPSFLPLNGAATVNLTDPQLHGAVVRMLSANGYLYIFGRSSINIIGNVYIPTNATTGAVNAPPTPLFTNVNIQANIGCDQPASIFLYGTDVVFANRYGAQVLNGTNVERLSQDIDGTWQYIDFSQPISGGCAIVQNILNACFLIKRGDAPDEVDIPNVPDLDDDQGIACFFNGKWWFASLNSLGYPKTAGYITLIAQGMVNNAPTLFAMDQYSNFHQLFADYTTAPPSQWSTPLWAMDDQLSDKQVIRAGVEISISSLPGSLTVTVDTPNVSIPFAATPETTPITFVNNSGNAITFVNNSLQPLTFYAGNYFFYAGATPGSYGKYVGMSGFSNGAIYQLSSVFMDYKLRARY